MAEPLEEITLFVNAEIKEFLVKESEKEGTSMNEFILRRCLEPPMTDQEKQVLASLVNEVNISAKRAKGALDEGLNALNTALAECKVNI